MNVTRDDLKRLRVPLSAAIILLVLGGSSLVASGYYLDEARTAQNATRLTRVAAQERVLRARIKNDRKLFEIRYNFDAQRPLDYPGMVPTSAADFVVSRLKLDMLLLHEGDLLNFLADLQSGIKAHVSVRSCVVSRVERGAAPGATSLQPRLRAECQVDLISVRGLRPA